MTDPHAVENGRTPAILLTGRPGIGKTTVIRKVVSGLEGRAGGFTTRELREGGRRTGFELATLSGQTAPLATTEPDVKFEREARMGRYRVNLEALDGIGVPALREAWQAGELVIVDEIGPMELLSEAFRDAIFGLLDADVPVLGTVYQRSHRVADRVKAHERVQVLTVTAGNRDALPEQLIKMLRISE